ncbi:hypothetical protein [Sphingomonas arantia]|uniref:hypothetical protein n=1 Tax=Sphingomonas arantia TaxID=1460676 RepID=UPI0036D311B8
MMIHSDTADRGMFTRPASRAGAGSRLAARLQGMFDPRILFVALHDLRDRSSARDTA